MEVGAVPMGGLQRFQASLVTGAMIVFMGFVFLRNYFPEGPNRNRTIEAVFSLSEHAPLGLLVIFSLLLGIIFTNSIEGTVDRLQHKYLASSTPNGKICRHLWEMIAPLSPNARTRLRSEALGFYEEHRDYLTEYSTPDTFADQVIADTLWMDGKLVGTPIGRQYGTFRAQGELGVCIGILLIPTVASLCIAFDSPATLTFIAIITAVAGGIKLIEYGLYYYRRANSLIAHFAADGIVLTPTMETATRKRQRWEANSRKRRRNSNSRGPINSQTGLERSRRNRHAKINTIKGRTQE